MKYEEREAHLNLGPCGRTCTDYAPKGTTITSTRMLGCWRLSYVKKSGRRYAVGSSMQYLPKKWRARFSEGTMIDLDFECSIPKVLVILAESEGLGHLLDVTKDYALHSKIWTRFFGRAI